MFGGFCFPLLVSVLPVPCAPYSGLLALDVRARHVYTYWLLTADSSELVVGTVYERQRRRTETETETDQCKMRVKVSSSDRFSCDVV